MNWIHLSNFLQIPKCEMKDPKVPAKSAFYVRSLGKIMQENELFLLSQFHILDHKNKCQFLTYKNQHDALQRRHVQSLTNNKRHSQSLTANKRHIQSLTANKRHIQSLTTNKRHIQSLTANKRHIQSLTTNKRHIQSLTANKRHIQSLTANKRHFQSLTANTVNTGFYYYEEITFHIPSGNIFRLQSATSLCAKYKNVKLFKTV